MAPKIKDCHDCVYVGVPPEFWPCKECTPGGSHFRLEEEELTDKELKGFPLVGNLNNHSQKWIDRAEVATIAEEFEETKETFEDRIAAEVAAEYEQTPCEECRHLLSDDVETCMGCAGENFERITEERYPQVSDDTLASDSEQAVSETYPSEDYIRTESVGTAVPEIKDSGKRTEFATGAVRDAQGGKGRFDLLPAMTMWALARHYEKGCKKYGDRNWEKGIPIKNYMDSAMRHYVEYMLGLDDENHLIAAIWNLMCAYETKLRISLGLLPEELDNLPYPLKGLDIANEKFDTWEMFKTFLKGDKSNA